MESKSDNPPLICIVGETASGKTALAIELALQFNGEIIAADSRTLYKGMDIGTAKPTSSELSAVPHHLVDITTPDKPITAAQYAERAKEAIAGVATRGHVPFLVGGTGLYIDAVLYDFAFLHPPDPNLRERLQAMSVEELQSELIAKGIALPENERNPRHLMRKLETDGKATSQRKLRPNTLIIAIDVDRDILLDRVTRRTDRMLEQGLAKEASSLFDLYGTDCSVLQTIGYQEFLPYIAGQSSIDDVRQAIVRGTMRLAKRQRTWFKRNKSIQYICKKEESVDLVTTFLNKEPVGL
jgi:tRNA dimethylallyltransferase